MRVNNMDTIERTSCVITGSENLEKLYEFKDFPINQDTTDEPEKKDLLMNLRYDICRDSGVIQVRNLPTEELLYNTEHSRSIGKTWQDHHREFASFIEKSNPHEVFEIGGGSGYIEKYYNESRIERTKWVILEPNPDPADGCHAEYVIGFFDEKYEIPERFDTIVFSHLFEHIFRPDSFMGALAASMQSGKKLIFSIPDMRAMLKNKQTNTLNFEHTFYLAEPYVDYLLQKNRIKTVRKEHYRQHSIFYSCEYDKNMDTAVSCPDLYEENKRLFSEFTKEHESFARDVMGRLPSVSEHNVYLFGAHLFSQFLIAFGIDEHAVKSILDNDRHKQGRRLRGCGLICESPEVLRSDREPIVILRAGTYQQEIKRDILEKINSKTIFWE